MTGPDDNRAASWSLRRSLTRMLVLAALLPVLVFGVALLVGQWQRDRDDLMLRLSTGAQSSASTFDDFLDGHLAGVRLLAATPASGSASPRPDAELDRLLKAYPSFLRALATDAEGNIVAARGASGRPAARAEENAADRDWFRAPRDSGLPHVSEGYHARIYGDEALIAVSAPMFREGRFDGVLQASLPVERLVRERANTLRRRGLELLLLDRGGRVVFASSNLRWHFLDPLGALGADILRGATATGQVARARILPGLLAGDERAYVDAVRMRTGWTVAVIAPEQRLLTPSLPRLGLMLGLLAATMIGVLLVLGRMRRLLASNMGRLLSSLHGYALGGTMDPSQLSRMPEELQPLAGGIGDLAARMNAAYGELREALDQREHAIADRTRELSDAVAKLDRLSRTDALTGCLNYRGFQEEGLRLWQAASDRCDAFAVLAIDIDHFKAYNDHYGHLHGDGALKRFAGVVRSALLHADDVLARQGGEEFAVLLPGATITQARAAAARIRERLREADITHAAAPLGRVTASIGIAAMAAGEQVALGTLLTQADAALYRAKSRGRDRAEV
ncbi:diguanylate cyclase [Pseudoluteimonas lycopersici]|uniref:diguanylate cyclase n=1 Tax=Pseudoluteimonas lycopersici TaxID=1324796 RepID=A0A516V520_9GAMM|nr:diguanylate cyclase [Lysobacter lycopersici]QDQ73636.1 diguanylate cyclase [Lysobacter lycopersici]